jgi:outer membrane protein assembly factor BamB
MKRRIVLGLVIITLLTNCCIVLAQPTRQTPTSDPEPLAAIDWWTQSRHDAANTGSTTGYAPTSFQQKWQSTLYDEAYSTTPIIVNNHVYINTNSYYFLTPPPNRTLDSPPCTNLVELMKAPPTSTGSLECLSATNGAILWSNEYTSPNDPAYLDGNLYFTDLDFNSQTHHLYCINATTGSQVYTKTIAEAGSTPITIANDKLYFGTINLDSYNSHVYGTSLSGDQVWSYQLPANHLLLSAPAVDNGNIYFISIDLYNYYTGSLICLNADTGAYKWSQTVGNLFLVLYSPNVPTAAQGNVYVTDFNLQTYNSYVRCFNGNTGTPTWSHTFNDGFSLAAPAVSDGYVYTSVVNLYTYANEIVKLSASTGAINWTIQTPGLYSLISTTICTADAVISSSNSGYYGYSYAGSISAYDKTTGAYLWSHESSTGILSGISVADDTLYYIDDYSTVHAIADQLKITSFKGGILAAKAMLTNLGNQTYTNLQTRIVAAGGTNNNIHISKDITIDTIQPGQTIPIRIGPIIGFGTVRLDIYITLPQTGTMHRNATAKALGIFTRII